MKIESLSREQIAMFPEYVRRWTDIGLSTKPAERKAAEAGILRAYSEANIPPPERIVWCGSPVGGALTRAFVLAEPKQKPGDSVRASVWASVGASVGDSVWASVRASVWAACWGQHDASWLAFYDFFKQECGLEKETEKLAGLITQAQAAGWWWPHERICWVTERPVILNRDERGRLHCEDGPAMQYPDGWSLYRFHGVQVPEYVIENPLEITIEKIEAEGNAEVRRVMVERYAGGMAKYILDSKAEIVAKDEFGTLYRKREKNDEDIWMVHVVCPSTNREYFLGVDPNAYGGLQTARAAVASTWRNGDHSMLFPKPEDYQPVIQT
jgi:hypothetical protein